MLTRRTLQYGGRRARRTRNRRRGHAAESLLVRIGGVKYIYILECMRLAPTPIETPRNSFSWYAERNKKRRRPAA